MTLSFLYRAFCRILQLDRRCRPRPATKNRPAGRPHPRVPDGLLSWADGVLGTHRFWRGALAAMVRDNLAARPKESFGPAALGKALGRSQGAVSNALAAMAAR